MEKWVLTHHRLPDGVECVFNRASGAYDLPVKYGVKEQKRKG
jgi:hypothetical protein